MCGSAARLVACWYLCLQRLHMLARCRKACITACRLGTHPAWSPASPPKTCTPSAFSCAHQRQGLDTLKSPLGLAATSGWTLAAIIAVTKGRKSEDESVRGRGGCGRWKSRRAEDWERSPHLHVHTLLADLPAPGSLTFLPLASSQPQFDYDSPEGRDKSAEMRAGMEAVSGSDWLASLARASHAQRCCMDETHRLGCWRPSCPPPRARKPSAQPRSAVSALLAPLPSPALISPSRCAPRLTACAATSPSRPSACRS